MSYRVSLVTQPNGQIERGNETVGFRRIPMMRILQLTALALALGFQALPSHTSTSQARHQAPKAPAAVRSANATGTLTAVNN